MAIYLGIDGGQTTTIAVLMDESGKILGAGSGGPANHIHEPGGPERIRKSLSDAIRDSRSSAGVGDSEIVSAYLGMTGGSAEMEDLCRPTVLSENVKRMSMGHDSLIALYSITFGRPGVVVIGGTGSVGFGRDAEGRTARAGGWGYVFGDEGSGYWIAVRALNACARAADGIAPRTALLQYLLRALKVSNLPDIHRLVYSGSLSRPDIAALATSVHEAAVKRDSAAQSILRTAGEELGNLAVAVIRSLKCQNEHVTVGMAGGVFNAGAWVTEPFKRIVLEEAPSALVSLPEIPAAAGAALLALEGAGGVVDERVIQNVKASLSRTF